MRFHLVIVFIFSTSLLFSQDFNSKPLSTGKSWIDQKLSNKDIKKKLKKEFEVTSESDSLIKFEREDEKGKYYVKAFFKNNAISSISFNYPLAYHSDFSNEIMNDLGYEFGVPADGESGGPEFLSIEHYFKTQNGMEIIVLLLNEKTKRVWVSFGGNSVSSGVMPNFQ